MTESDAWARTRDRLAATQAAAAEQARRAKDAAAAHGPQIAERGRAARDLVSSHAATGVAAGQRVLRDSATLTRDAAGRPIRPWEITIAAILGFFAPAFVAGSIVMSVYSGTSGLRWLTRMLRVLGAHADEPLLVDLASAGSTVSRMILILSIVVAVLVTAAFAIYGWRVLVGRRRSRAMDRARRAVARAPRPVADHADPDRGVPRRRGDEPRVRLPAALIGLVPRAPRTAAVATRRRAAEPSAARRIRHVE